MTSFAVRSVVCEQAWRQQDGPPSRAGRPVAPPQVQKGSGEEVLERSPAFETLNPAVFCSLQRCMPASLAPARRPCVAPFGATGITTPSPKRFWGRRPRAVASSPCLRSWSWSRCGRRTALSWTAKRGSEWSGSERS